MLHDQRFDSSIHRFGGGQDSCGIPGLLSLPHRQYCHVKVSVKRGGQNKQSEPPTTVSNNSLQIESEKKERGIHCCFQAGTA